jgi:hypothetical protein
MRAIFDRLRRRYGFAVSRERDESVNVAIRPTPGPPRQLSLIAGS